MEKLMLLQDGQATPFDLEKDEMVIGRLPECDIQLPSNMVSRRHAKVTRAGQDIFIEDLGSGNGTFLNGKRLETSTKLKGNDRLKFGPILMRFVSGRPEDEDSSSSFLRNTSGQGQVEIDDQQDGGLNHCQRAR